MSEPNVRLSESAMAFIQSKVQADGPASADEVVEALVQKAIRREARHRRIEELLIEGLDSGGKIELTPQYWEDLRNRIEARQPARKGKAT